MLIQSRILFVAWILLLLLGGFFLFASISDLLADGRIGLPSDHLGAFNTLTKLMWKSAQQSSTIPRYITTLEIAYAVHELVFGLLYVLIVA